MRERDLIVGVLAAQAGFVTPSEVLAAAAGGLVDSGPESLLTRLEKTGALNAERRKALEALAEQALAARNGDARAVLTTIGAASGAIETLVSAVAAGGNGVESARAAAAIPLERPGQYTRLQELGRGSQSVVRAARDEIVGREVALKELVALAEPGKDESSRAAQARFLREVRLVAGLDHPGIVNILELARREDGTLFCAQKLIRGETLQVRLARCHSLGDRLALLRHVLDACQAMGFAHSKHVIHRDLKPSNIMVGEYGETVVVDWGLAKHREEAEDVVPLIPSSPEPGLTVAGVALGTPAYMSPEQAKGDLPAIDAQSDVFSLGAILYQVLTGRPPFEGATSDHILENVRAGTFAPVRMLAPDAPPELAAIAGRALSVEPSERYRHAEELAKELAAYLSGGRVRAYQYGTWELVRKFASNHRALTAALAVALGSMLVSAVVVGFRIHITHRNLARSFVERAHEAERQSDWALASVYYAAARTEHDTTEARWGVALAAARAPEQILSVPGETGSFTDVGVLPDGRVIALGTTPNRVEIREIDGGKVLWSRDAPLVSTAAVLPGGKVRLALPREFAFFDAATGAPLERFDRETDGRPCPGAYPPPVTVLKERLVARREGQQPVVLAAAVSPVEPRCTVSPDRQQVAYLDPDERVHLLSVSDGRTIAEKPATDLRNFFFSPHGLVLVREGWVETLGAPGGDFTIPLGDPSQTNITGRTLGGEAISPDGHLVVVARRGLGSAEVVDLRTRTVRGVVYFGPGRPRFAFSLDGNRLFAAGHRHRAHLAAWRLPPDQAPVGHPGSWDLALMDYSDAAPQLAMFETRKRLLEIYGENGQRSTEMPLDEDFGGFGIPRDGLLWWGSWTTNQVTLWDVSRRVMLWAHPCRTCTEVHVTRDGSRLGLFGLDGLEVWDATENRVLFHETGRVRGLETLVDLSPDGRLVVWNEGVVVHLREVNSGTEQHLDMHGGMSQIRFDPGSTRLAVATSEGLKLWELAPNRLLWQAPQTTVDQVTDLRWSYDGRSLLAQYASFGTDVFDAGSGERLVRIPSTGRNVSIVRPDLRATLVASRSHWDLRPLPLPETQSATESLATTLRKAGLVLDGLEIAAAP